MNRKQNHAGTIGRSILLAVIFMLAGSTIALADETAKFVPGTKVNGVLVGGMTVEEAKVQIEGFYGREYNLSVKEKDSTTEVIKGTDIDYQVVITDGLQAVLNEQNASGRVAGPAEDNSNKIQSTVTYNEEKLNEKLASLKCVSDSSIIKTQNARISSWQEGTAFSIIPEVYGNSVNIDELRAAVKGALAEESREIDLEALGCYDTVTITSEDASLIAQCDALNQVRDMEVTYAFGSQTEVLSGEQISSWVFAGSDGGIEVSQEKAAEFVKTLADKYDTAGKGRIFHATDGRELTLSGAYGWQIDQAREIAELTAVIKTGQSQTKEPQYSQSAADRNTDWGGTYIEVDMEGQHVYMYKDGVLVWDSPCVTGNVAKNYTTPEGIYTLNYKEKDRVLRGAKQADGTYEYESPVSYWMPFNGGIGFHDASWRSKFGGSIYKSNGSHGCVNLPSAKAKALYELIYTGIPIICHY